MAHTHENTHNAGEPVTGPFPPGDSRNLTLTQGSNAFEPERTGPQEPTYRDVDAPESVLGAFEETELSPGASAPDVNGNPSWVQIGKGAVGDTLNALTPGSKTSSVMGGLLDKVGEVLALDVGSSKSETGSENSNGSENDSDARAKRYTLSDTPRPGAAETAFGGVGGAVNDPLLQEDWNPAERNSDDLSR